MDFLSLSGSAAGLMLRGTQGEFRSQIRWDLDGGSVTAEFTGHQQMNRKDFEGSPPLILRFEMPERNSKGEFQQSTTPTMSTCPSRCRS